MEKIFEKLSSFRSLSGSVQILNAEIAQIKQQIEDLNSQLTLIFQKEIEKKEKLTEDSEKLSKIIDELNADLSSEKKNLEKFSEEVLELEKKGFFDTESQNILREKFSEEEKKYNDFNYVLELFGAEKIEIPKRNFIFIPKN